MTVAAHMKQMPSDSCHNGVTQRKHMKKMWRVSDSTQKTIVMRHSIAASYTVRR